MGGALILLAIAISTVLWANLENRFVLIALGGTLFFGVIGFVDDYKKVVLRNSKGLSARQKIFWQTVGALGLAFTFYVTAENPPVENVSPEVRKGSTAPRNPPARSGYDCRACVRSQVGRCRSAARDALFAR